MFPRPRTQGELALTQVSNQPQISARIVRARDQTSYGWCAEHASDATWIAFCSRMHASRQRPQPTHCPGSMRGLLCSQHKAPGTGQLPAQAPHSGPRYGRQVSVSTLATATRGNAGSSGAAPGRFSALGSQAATHGHAAHRWQPLFSRSRAGVPTTRAPSRAEREIGRAHV